VTTYTYDRLNRIVRVEYADGSFTNNAIECPDLWSGMKIIIKNAIKENKPCGL